MTIFCVGKNEIIGLFNNIISSVFDNYFENYIKLTRIKNIYIYTYFPSYYAYLSFKEYSLRGYFYIGTEINDLKNTLLKVSRCERIEVDYYNLFSYALKMKINYRELKVVKLYAKFGTQDKVAKYLNYSERGISTILSRLYNKLEISGFSLLFLKTLKYNLFCRTDFYDDIYDMGLDISRYKNGD